MEENKQYDLLAVGELLGDFIGIEFAESLRDTGRFQRLQGGSPANLAANMARLGKRTALVSCVGDENLGNFLIDEVAKTGVDTNYIVKDTVHPTSIVLVSRTKSTPDFIPYRQSDAQLLPKHLPDELLKNSRIFHTTCWPLSLSPASETVLDAAKRAAGFGTLLSLDFNYSPKIWPDIRHAANVLAEFCSYGAFVKMSEDDADRFFGENDAEKVINKLLRMGAKAVCYTLGAKGSLIAESGSEERQFIPAKLVEVIDATGAGDAYWSGFLTAYLDDKSLAECGKAGVNMASLKLTTVGALPEMINKAFLYEK